MCCDSHVRQQHPTLSIQNRYPLQNSNYRLNEGRLWKGMKSTLPARGDVVGETLVQDDVSAFPNNVLNPCCFSVGWSNSNNAYIGIFSDLGLRKLGHPAFTLRIQNRQYTKSILETKINDQIEADGEKRGGLPFITGPARRWPHNRYQKRPKLCGPINKQIAQAIDKCMRGR